MKTLAEYMSLPYAAVVIQDEDMRGKSCYRAENPQLPGCMSHGETPKEAMQNLEEARRLYIQTRLDLNLEVPVPAVITTASHSSAGTMVLVPFASSVMVVSTPSVDTPVEIDLPASYDMMAEQAA
jgi:antitoxin HicB